MDVSFGLEGADAFVQAIASMMERTAAVGVGAVKTAADEVAKEASADAPRGRTGDLSRAFRVETKADGEEFAATVGPTGLAYARRIEMGFHRRDARGRVYHQSGSGFFRKAEQRVLPRFGDAIVDVWGRALTE